jgi:hypothetical protein
VRVRTLRLLPDRGRAAGGGRGPGGSEEWGVWVGGSACEHATLATVALLQQSATR